MLCRIAAAEHRVLAGTFVVVFARAAFGKAERGVERAGGGVAFPHRAADLVEEGAHQCASRAAPAQGGRDGDGRDVGLVQNGVGGDVAEESAVRPASKEMSVTPPLP